MKLEFDDDHHDDSDFMKGWNAGHDACLRAHFPAHESNLRLLQALREQLDAEKQKVADLQELLDRTRQIALDLDQKVMRGKA